MPCPEALPGWCGPDCHDSNLASPCGCCKGCWEGLGACKGWRPSVSCKCHLGGRLGRVGQGWRGSHSGSSPVSSWSNAAGSERLKRWKSKRPIKQNIKNKKTTANNKTYSPHSEKESARVLFYTALHPHKQWPHSVQKVYGQERELWRLSARVKKRR